MMQAASMKGEAALVTGAASGLGRATALKLAALGANLTLVDVNQEGLTETAELLGDSGVEILIHPADLADPAACRNAVATAVARFGRLDALCNVAGLIYLTNVPDMPEELYRRTMAVNLDAPFLLCQAAIPHLLETSGAIVNVTSCASYIGEAYAVAYASSKWGLLGMTKSLAMEYMRKPIRINAVAPGGMMTNIATNFRPPEGCDIELLKRYSPLRGLVEVDDVADAIAFLASDASRGYHGASISIDAGQTAG